MQLLLLFSFVVYWVTLGRAGRVIPWHDDDTTSYEVMASVLRDQGLPEPEIGVNYGFAEYWNGNAIENICNGGAQ
jgi:hypothetical protein